ncbi:MAG: serine protease [Muribaculaceae bacterium]
MKKVILIIVVVIAIVFLWRNCITSGTKTNGYRGVVSDAQGNELILQSGLHVRLLGVANDTRVEKYLQSQVIGKRVRLVADSRATKKKFMRSNDHVAAYVVETEAHRYCMNRQVVMAYNDAYRKTEPTDSTGWLADGESLKEITQLGLYMKARTFLILNQATGSLGTGFFINDQGLAVTNWHVLRPEDAATSCVYFYDQNPDSNKLLTSDPRRITKVHWSQDISGLDLCIFSVEMRDDDRREFFRIARNRPTIGTELGCMGNPGGESVGVMTANYTQGVVSRFEHGLQGRDVDFIGYDLATNPGNSGGPVCDVYGQIVAVHDLGYKDMQMMNFGIDAQQLRAVLNQLGISYGGM